MLLIDGHDTGPTTRPTFLVSPFSCQFFFQNFEPPFFKSEIALTQGALAQIKIRAIAKHTCFYNRPNFNLSERSLCERYFGWSV